MYLKKTDTSLDSNPIGRIQFHVSMLIKIVQKEFNSHLEVNEFKNKCVRIKYLSVIMRQQRVCRNTSPYRTRPRINQNLTVTELG